MTKSATVDTKKREMLYLSSSDPYDLSIGEDGKIILRDKLEEEKLKMCKTDFSGLKMIQFCNCSVCRKLTEHIQGCSNGKFYLRSLIVNY